MGVGKVLPNPFCRAEKIYRVVAVLVDTGCHREDIGIEYDIVWRKLDLVDKYIVSTFTDRNPALIGIGLALFVKRHHHYSGPVALNEFCLPDKLLFTTLQADRIDNTLPLKAFESCFDNFPFRGIDHDRHAGDLRLRRHQIEELHHGGPGIEHAFIHVDIDDLCTAANLFQGDFKGLIVLVFLDKTEKFLRTRHIGTFTDVDEVRLWRNLHCLQATYLQGTLHFSFLGHSVFTSFTVGPSSHPAYATNAGATFRGAYFAAHSAMTRI